MTMHLETWSTGKGAPACGAVGYDWREDQTQNAVAVNCQACQRWLVGQWRHWAHAVWIEAGLKEAVGTHYLAWRTLSERARGLCLQEVGAAINATGTIEHASCAACQYALMSRWKGEEPPRFRCAYCAGETLSWVGGPTKCAHCKRVFLDVRDDPEFVASVRSVVDAIRKHVRKYPERYGPGSSLTLDMDHVCSYLTLTIGEEWQDEDRIFTPAERVLSVRLDCQTERREAA